MTNGKQKRKRFRSSLMDFYGDNGGFPTIIARKKRVSLIRSLWKEGCGRTESRSAIATDSRREKRFSGNRATVERSAWEKNELNRTVVEGGRNALLQGYPSLLYSREKRNDPLQKETTRFLLRYRTQDERSKPAVFIEANYLPRPYCLGESPLTGKGYARKTSFLYRYGSSPIYFRSSDPPTVLLWKDRGLFQSIYDD